MHLAALVGTPVVAMFGPTSPERFGPWTDRRIVLRAADCECPWSECARSVDGHPSCLAALEPAVVVAALRDLLRPGAPARAGAVRAPASGEPHARVHSRERHEPCA
jgi:ADP-heptose:LPS heptosyltransferase